MQGFAFCAIDMGSGLSHSCQVAASLQTQQHCAAQCWHQQRFCQCRGFAFLAYQDQRSTVLAVDNLNGAIVSGRTIRVEHVDNYRKKKAEVRYCI